MQKKYVWLFVLSILLPVLVSILITLAPPGQVPPVLRPILPFIWPLILFCVLIIIIVAVLLGRIQAPIEQNMPPRNQNRHQLLVKVRSIWIKNFLKQSLYGTDIILPGLHDQSGAVAPPQPKYLYSMIHTDSEPPSSYAEIGRAYEEANGQLLILGKPGAGKTTLLLKLTQNLLERAEKVETFPVPVVFLLSSWVVKQQPLAEWLSEELHGIYGVQHKLGKAWLEHDHILPLLDGLDEVDSKHREACIKAINTFMQEHGLISMVVCSRIDEYFAQSARLSLQKAVTIEPLTQEQIETYCSNASGQLKEVLTGLQDDASFQELITTPLMLNVLTRAFSGKSTDGLQQETTTPILRRKQIFTAYVAHMLERKDVRRAFTKQQTVHWLTWLAQQLNDHDNQTQFYLERIQPNWLPEGWFRRLIAGIPVVIVTGLILSLLMLLGNPLLAFEQVDDTAFGPTTTFGPTYDAALFTLVLGILGGLMYMLNHDGKKAEIKLYEVIHWDWRVSWNAFLTAARAIWAAVIQELIKQKLNVVSSLKYLLVASVCLTGLGIVLGLFTAIVQRDYYSEGILGTHYYLVWPGFSEVGVELLIGMLVMLVMPFFVLFLYSLWLVAVGLWKLFCEPLIAGLSVSALEDRKRKRTNVGVWRSAINGLVFSLIAGVGAGLIAGQFVDSGYGLLVGLDIVVVVWFLCGGYGCFRHLMLRLFLREMDYAPLNYARFLDFAAERILLRKVGGGYIFFHKLFQDYLVETHQESTEQLDKYQEIQDEQVSTRSSFNLFMATVAGTALFAAASSISFSFPRAGSFYPDFLVAAFFGASFGSGVGFFTGSLGYLLGQTVFHPFEYTFSDTIAMATTGFVAGFAQFLARGRFNSLRSAAFAGLLGAIGIVLSLSLILSADDRLSSFGESTWLNALACFLVLPLFLLIHDRISKRRRGS